MPRSHHFPIVRWRIASVLASVLGLGITATAVDAAAQSTIRYPGDRSLYQVELEPHLLLGAFDPPGSGSGTGLGAGGRASIELVKRGFVDSINDSVAIGFGLDFLHYGGSSVAQRGTCVAWASNPSGGPPVCTEIHQPGSPADYMVIPVVLQWNFWLTHKWSVFGEPGLAMYWDDYSALRISPVLYLGGRYQFSDKLGLTFRIGYPTLSIGLSFFL